jgi:hypothetical protein
MTAYDRRKGGRHDRIEGVEGGKERRVEKEEGR